MAFEMKEKTFTLFTNDKKGNDKAPDMKGKGLLDGKEIKIAIWKKTGKTGVEYWSGNIEFAAQEPAEAPKEEKQEGLLDDQQIPF